MYASPRQVGQNIRKVRMTNGYSLPEIGKVLQKTQQAVSNNESGAKYFTLEDIMRLCRKFKDVTPNQLLGYEPLPLKYNKK